jgi:DNA-binding transcriptional LysR family regulator
MDLGDEAFMPNPIVVIAPTSDPLAKRSAVPLHELVQRRFIFREKGSGTRMAGDQFFRQMKFRPDVRLELGSNEAIKESVAGGPGCGRGLAPRPAWAPKRKRRECDRRAGLSPALGLAHRLPGRQKVLTAGAGLQAACAPTNQSAQMTVG